MFRTEATLIEEGIIGNSTVLRWVPLSKLATQKVPEEQGDDQDTDKCSKDAIDQPCEKGLRMSSKIGGRPKSDCR